MAKMQPFWWFLKPVYPKPPYNPAVWNYDNLQGFIWLEGNPAGYDNAPLAKGDIREPTGIDPLGEAKGGTYDNRA